jgi:hypothetical protein
MENVTRAIPGFQLSLRQWQGSASSDIALLHSCDQITNHMTLICGE